jgi:hypothetical protein
MKNKVNKRMQGVRRGLRFLNNQKFTLGFTDSCIFLSLLGGQAAGITANGL